MSAAISGQARRGSADSGSKKKRKRQSSIDRNLSCEEMDSDDLDGDLNLSDEEGGANRRTQLKSMK